MSEAKQSMFERVSEWGPFKLIATKIRYKLLVGLLAVALIPLIGLGWATNRSTENALMAGAFSQLESVRTIKQHQVEGYFDTLHKQLATFADNRMTREAMRDFNQAFKVVRDENKATAEDIAKYKAELKTYYSNEFSGEYKKQNDGKLPPVDQLVAKLDDDSVFLQYQYIKANTNPLGSKDQLDRAGDKSSYSDAHERFHPVMRNYLKKFGLYDIFLVDIETGDIVYTCFKELDFTTSLKTGAYSTTNIGRAFSLAAQGEGSDSVVLVDYEAYTPSYDQAASFIATPIFDEGQKIGVAIFQIPIDKVNEIMAERTGLGESGETYAIGSDKLWRNNTRFLSDLGVSTTILKKEFTVETEAAVQGLAGKTGSKVINDYRGQPVLSAFTPITIHKAAVAGDNNINWALLSEIDLAEVRKPVVASFWNTVAIIALAALVVTVASLWFAKQFTKQADAISGMLSQIGIGLFDARAEIVTQDELGLVAVSLNAMCDNTLSLIQSREERDQIEASVNKLKAEVALIANGDLTSKVEVEENITGGIAESVNDMIDQLRGLVANVQNATMQVSASANQIQTTTEHLVSGSESQSSQIFETTNAVEDMATSIQQVTENTITSEGVATKARESAAKGALAVKNTIQGMERIRDQVQDSAKRIKRLGETSQEVGEIVQLIGDIADRTSILALNASIQAAIAGEAGQGFAVVAEEVERLAERANEATKQIATLIKAIKNDTSEAIAAMEESTKEVVNGTTLAADAGKALEEIDGVSTQLAELISSIAMSSKQQARGAESVSKAMTGIAEVTQQTAAGTKQAAVSVNSMAKLADELYGSVSRFKLPGGSSNGGGVAVATRTSSKLDQQLVASIEGKLEAAEAGLASEFSK